jgi:hypothetical protein
MSCPCPAKVYNYCWHRSYQDDCRESIISAATADESVAHDIVPVMNFCTAAKAALTKANKEGLAALSESGGRFIDSDGIHR